MEPIERWELKKDVAKMEQHLKELEKYEHEFSLNDNQAKKLATDFYEESIRVYERFYSLQEEIKDPTVWNLFHQLKNKKDQDLRKNIEEEILFMPISIKNPKCRLKILNIDVVVLGKAVIIEFNRILKLLS